MKHERTAPRWLFVDAIPHFGGHEVMLLRWLETLQQATAVQPRLLARAGGRLLALAPAASRVAPFVPALSQGRLRGLVNLWRECRTMRGALRAERPEIVVCVTGALGYQIPFVLLARWWRVPVLVYVPMLGTFESMGYRLGWVKDLFVRWLYSRVPNGWVAITAAQAEEFRRWARPRGPVFVLPNTVARRIEDAPRLVLRTLAESERLRVLVLGRLDAPQKGLDLLLQHLEAAAPEVRSRLRICIAGEGPYSATLQARLQANPALADCLQLQPWVEAPEAMAAHDVLLLPSRFEGVPLVMLEAMALGLPVVASDLPGVRAHVAPECLFAVGDLPAAFDILGRLRDRSVRLRLADAGRARYETQASAAAFQQAVAALTHDVRAALVGPAATATPLPIQPHRPHRPHDKPSA